MKEPVECWRRKRNLVPTRKAYHVRLCVALFSTSAPVWYRSLIKLDALPEKALMHKEGAAGFWSATSSYIKPAALLRRPTEGNFLFYITCRFTLNTPLIAPNEFHHAIGALQSASENFIKLSYGVEYTGTELLRHYWNRVEIEIAIGSNETVKSFGSGQRGIIHNSL